MPPFILQYTCWLQKNLWNQYSAGKLLSLMTAPVAALVVQFVGEAE